jgi:hypothetical protein
LSTTREQPENSTGREGKTNQKEERQVWPMEEGEKPNKTIINQKPKNKQGEEREGEEKDAQASSCSE